MQNDSDHVKSTEKILRRVEGLADGTSADAVELRHAEVLAAIADGTIHLEDLDEQTLDQLMDTFGIDAVTRAFRERPEKKSEVAPSVTSSPARVLQFPAQKWVRSGWMATAASLVAVVAVGWFITRAPDEISTPKDTGQFEVPWWRWTPVPFRAEDIWERTTPPRQAVPEPLNPWTAGIPGVVLLNPQFLDIDSDGAAEGLVYRYAKKTDSGGTVDALAVFVDVAETISLTDTSAASRVPRGLWGSDEDGAFPVQFFVLLRADGLVAAGYANAQGVVDEVRIGQFSDIADEVWKLEGSVWTSARPAATVPLMDSPRLGTGSEQTARALVDAAFGRSQQ
jgi:hypothetical protein